MYISGKGLMLCIYKIHCVLCFLSIKEIWARWGVGKTVLSAAQELGMSARRDQGERAAK